MCCAISCAAISLLATRVRVLSRNEAISTEAISTGAFSQPAEMIVFFHNNASRMCDNSDRTCQSRPLPLRSVRRRRRVHGEARRRCSIKSASRCPLRAAGRARGHG